ncbi:MAG: riboflavin synthase [Chloroflexi bacterium]|nr:riboflavin synthase [Chloroflexota bacterium]
MFTGIVEEVGQVVEAAPNGLRIAGGSVMDSLAISDSIAVNGVCLTVTERTATDFTLDLSEETLTRTNLGDLAPGGLVNLERALTPSSRMGGHVVQGHVDGAGRIVAFGGTREARELRIDLPPDLARYVVEKGFIAVDGISLTVASQEGAVFSVAVIPYTEQHTALRVKKTGDRVNIEVDILAKYVERLTASQALGGR